MSTIYIAIESQEVGEILLNYMVKNKIVKSFKQGCTLPIPVFIIIYAKKNKKKLFSMLKKKCKNSYKIIREN